MKVLFITGSLNQGGAELQILKLAKLFKDKGNTVEVFAITNYSFYKEFVNKNSLKYSHLENDQNKIKRVILTSRKIKKFKPDLIFSYLKIVSKVALVAKFLSCIKVPLIVGERTSEIQPLHDLIHFNMMRFSDAIIVNSISKLNYLKSNFRSISDKIHFFPNLLNVGDFPFLEKNYKTDKLNLGYIGRISPEKNILKMINAVSILIDKGKEIHFSIYGDGRDSDYIESVKNLILSKNLSRNVKLMGQTNKVIEAYKEIDLIILISDYEGFSNVIAEALTCGLPIITSAIPENEYLVSDSINGFTVNHKDVLSIANGIEKFINLPIKIKQKISFNNRKKSEEIFDNDNLYNQYLKLIKEVID